jgi:hypothetical protein
MQRHPLAKAAALPAHALTGSAYHVLRYWMVESGVVPENPRRSGQPEAQASAAGELSQKGLISRSPKPSGTRAISGLSAAKAAMRSGSPPVPVRNTTHTFRPTASGSRIRQTITATRMYSSSRPPVANRADSHTILPPITWKDGLRTAGASDCEHHFLSRASHLREAACALPERSRRQDATEWAVSVVPRSHLHRW